MYESSQRDMVSQDVLHEFLDAYLRIRIVTQKQKDLHERNISLRFDGLLKSLLRQQFFAEYYFKVGLPEALRNLSYDSSKQEVICALSVVASNLQGGAFIFGDAFGLKRANDEGGLAGGNKMLQRIAEEIVAAGFVICGRLNIGDEFVAFHQGPSESAHNACERINAELASYLVAELPTRVDFGVAEHHVVARTCLALHGAGWQFDPLLERSPGQHFYDVAQKIGEIRSKIMKRFELLVLVLISLQMLHEEGSGHDEAKHAKLLESLLPRPNESLGLPDESWLSIPKEGMATYAKAQALSYLSLPKDANDYDSIVHTAAEEPFLSDS